MFEVLIYEKKIKNILFLKKRNMLIKLEEKIYWLPPEEAQKEGL